MRFMLITQYYPPEIGAAAVRLQAMVDELVRRGHQVDVVTALPNYPHGRIFEGYRGNAVSQGTAWRSDGCTGCGCTRRPAPDWGGCSTW